FVDAALHHAHVGPDLLEDRQRDAVGLRQECLRQVLGLVVGVRRAPREALALLNRLLRLQRHFFHAHVRQGKRAGRSGNRFAAPHSYGRAGARWYMSHHAFARRLSQHLASAVHAYVFDSDDLELVVSYGNGRHVGGETLRYEDAELPEDAIDDDDEVSFELM